MSVLATVAMVAGKSYKGKFTLSKNWFSSRVFYITIANADIGSLKSLHTLFDKYLDHMLVEFEFCDKKWLTIFDKVLTPF